MNNFMKEGNTNKMDKIIVRNTCIQINDYNFGDSPKLEHFFAVYEPVSHSYRFVGIYYDTETKTLYIPRGIDIWYVEQLLECKAKVEVNKYHKFDVYDNIGVKYLPRDEDQKKALRFAVGKGEYVDTETKSQLSINLDTGKGKTYVAVGTMSFFGIKSMVITYSKTVLTQWRNRVLEYTNITNKEIYSIDGSGSIYRLLTMSRNEIYNIKLFLVTHSTLKSYGDANGWDKITELFDRIRVGLKFYDEAHTNFDNMCMIDFFTNVYKTYYLTATPARSNDEENKIYQTSFKNVLAIDLFHEDTDPHTHYIAMRYNSRPSPQVISTCKNKYGLDRNKYTNYIVTNDNFMYMACIAFDFIFTNILKHPEDKLLVYIGTNNAISIFYRRIIEIFPALKGNVGIFTSIVSDEDKEYALTRKVILSTTKSAGAAMDIPNLKCTLVLAEPFKSAVLAKQTLGRTRAKNTYYIEIVDKGFINCNKYFLQKRNIFQVFAVDCKLVDISDVELYDKGNNIIISGMLDNVRNESWIKPFTVQQQMIKPFTINI